MINGDDGTFSSLLGAWSRNAWIEDSLGGGHRNDVRAVRIGGERYAARRSDRSIAAIQWELDLLGFLLSAGFRVPRPLSAQDGRLIVGDMVIYSWLDGEAPSGEREWRAVAHQLDQVHHLTRDWPQRPGFSSTLQLLEADAGGDVRLDLMPEQDVRLCRSAWVPLAGEAVAVVHGDPGPANIMINQEGIGFIDWDEARVDVPLLDFADLPIDLSDLVDQDRMNRARRAADAWEGANAWLKEPDYARRRLKRLKGFSRGSA